MKVPYGDIARLMHTAAQFEALEFYDFTFEHKLPPKLNLRSYARTQVNKARQLLHGAANP